MVTNTSRGSSRQRTAPRTSPFGNSIGISFALCTAISISSRRSASSSSRVNTPFPPKLASDRSRCRSPFVLIGTSSISISGKCVRMASLTSSVCTTASLLFLVPIRSFICYPLLSQNTHYFMPYQYTVFCKEIQACHKRFPGAGLYFLYFSWVVSVS